jgi:high-affinity nickel-transport protein
MNNSQSFFLILLVFTFGLRHGIDWDHIAAITDITGSEENRNKAFKLDTFYILGHAVIVIILGLLAVLIGISLPGWIDALMERVVGATLVILGIWLITSIVIHKHNFRMKSSRMFLLEQSVKLFNFIHDLFPHRHNHKHLAIPQNINRNTAFIIGMIHGIGAETPSQVLLFITASGVGKDIYGAFLVFIFVLGLIISNFIITILTVAGFTKTKDISSIRIILGLIFGVLSLLIGSLFLFDKANLLPKFFGT